MSIHPAYPHSQMPKRKRKIKYSMLAGTNPLSTAWQHNPARAYVVGTCHELGLVWFLSLATYALLTDDQKYFGISGISGFIFEHSVCK
jgi:hypothetical protein